MNTCTCESQEKMIVEILKLRKNDPKGQYQWVSLLYADEQKPCCMLTFLFYYAYCKECTTPLSEMARETLRPLTALSEYRPD